MDKQIKWSEWIKNDGHWHRPSTDMKVQIKHWDDRISTIDGEIPSRFNRIECFPKYRYELPKPDHPIVAYRVLKEPEVKTWATVQNFEAFHDGILYSRPCEGVYEVTPISVEITLTETNGQREWSISEVQSDG